jgi:Zn-dependent M16 (insulinase) family peptidase
VDPIEALRVHEVRCGGAVAALSRTSQAVRKLKAEIARGGLFERLMDEMLLRNPHRLLFILDADPQYVEAQAQLEAALLEKVLRRGCSARDLATDPGRRASGRPC